jgi:hypothetical protein
MFMQRRRAVKAETYVHAKAPRGEGGDLCACKGPVFRGSNENAT